MPDCDRKMWVYIVINCFIYDRRLIASRCNISKKYHGKEFKELRNMLRVQDIKYHEAYGGTKKGIYEETKMKDLYTRMGNCILTEMRSYDRSLRKLPPVPETKENNRRSNVRKSWLLSSALWNLKKSLKVNMKRD